MSKRTLELVAIAAVVALTGSSIAAAQQIGTLSPDAPFTKITLGAGVLFDQSGSCGGGSPASQQFPDFGNSVLQAADDFDVPAGAIWDVTQIQAEGTYFNGPGPLTAVFVEFFASDGPGGLPGTLLCSENNLTNNAADPSIDVTLAAACSLPEGTYWASVMAVMPFVPNGQFAWVVNDSTNGSEFAWQDPDGLTGNPCVTWGLGITTCGINAGFPDLCFALSGTVVPVELQSFDVE